MMVFTLSHMIYLVILRSRGFDYRQLSDVLICNLEHSSTPGCPVPSLWLVSAQLNLWYMYLRTMMCWQNRASSPRQRHWHLRLLKGPTDATVLKECCAFVSHQLELQSVLMRCHRATPRFMRGFMCVYLPTVLFAMLQAVWAGKLSPPHRVLHKGPDKCNVLLPLFVCISTPTHSAPDWMRCALVLCVGRKEWKIMAIQIK